MHSDTYVIVPAYNEASILEIVIKRLQKHFSNIVCIDDGSTDGTEAIIEKTPAVLISHPVNLGQGAAIQTGVDYALSQPKAKYFITFDGDGQHDVRDAIKMLDRLKSDSLDIVLGSRFLGQTKNISTSKKTFLWGAAVFNGLITGIRLTDSHVGLRVFNRKFAKKLEITMNGMAHATEIIDRIKRYDHKYCEMPVTITYSDYSKGKGQPMLNSVNIVVDVIAERIMKW